MHNFGFDFQDPIFEIGGWHLGLQVITFENTYGLDPEQTRLDHGGGTCRIVADRMMWAGNQEKAPGCAELFTSPTRDGLELAVTASMTRKIRCTKIIVRNLPEASIIGACWRESPIGDGAVLHYPPHITNNEDERLHTPLIFLKTATGDYVYFRSLDTRVRRKGFAVYHDPSGAGVTAELLFEELGPEMADTTATPKWRIGVTRDPDQVVSEHLEHLERHFNLVPWRLNPLIPGWLREIALVAYIHGQHWSGYIFNDYESMLGVIKELARRFEGRRILAHLAGWEGRYYWKYGDFTSDKRMGGAEAFTRLCSEARKLGVHIQVMLGGNCANTSSPGFQQWGDPSRLRTAGGAIERGNSPDWDTSRSYDHPWQAWLNPGAPGWHNHLLEQASGLIERHGVDGIFLDTHGNWLNDPNYPVYDGLLRWRDKLKRRYPNVLLSGEDWWDVLGVITPMSHAYWMALDRWPELFAKYNRTYGHNCWGDPGRNSSGVFEGGWREFCLVPEAEHAIPTLPIVDHTLEKAPEKVELVLEQARRYAAKYLEAER